MAVVRVEIETRKPLADGREFGDVGGYQQLDGTAHFAVDPGHPLNCTVTDIDLAERGRDGLVHFTSDLRILAPVDQAPGTIACCSTYRTAATGWHWRRSTACRGQSILLVRPTQATAFWCAKVIRLSGAAGSMTCRKPTG
jgi:hypothetical protein